MAEERKPKQVVAYLELEDNVGAILKKRKIEIPVGSAEDFDKIVRSLLQENG
jgi:hypothetical protein